MQRTPIPVRTIDAQRCDKLARLCGLLYLLFLPTCGFAIVGAQLALSGGGDVLERVQANRELLDIGIVAGAAGAVLWLSFALVLDALLRPVSPGAMRLLVVLATAGALLILAALAARMNVLSVIDDAQSLPAMSSDATRAHLLLSLRSSENLMTVSMLFSGLWLLPLGWSVFRSGFLPRTLGVLLMLGAPFYVSAFVGPVLDAGYENTLLAKSIGLIFGVPGTIGELGTSLWLLFGGTGRRAFADPTASAPNSRGDENGVSALGKTVSAH